VFACRLPIAKQLLEFCNNWIAELSLSFYSQFLVEGVLLLLCPMAVLLLQSILGVHACDLSAEARRPYKPCIAEVWPASEVPPRSCNSGMCPQVLRYGKEWHHFLARPEQYKSMKKKQGAQAEGDDEFD